MTKDDLELDTWRGEWRRLGETERLANDLLERVDRHARRIRRAAVLKMVEILVSIAIVAWLLFRTRGSVEVVAIAVVVVFFNGVWAARQFDGRANLFRSSGTNVEAFVNLTRRRLEADLRLATFGWKWLVALGAIVAPWMVWVFAIHRDAYLAKPIHAIVGFGATPAIMLASYFWARRKERRLTAERDAFERFIAAAL